MNNEREGRGRRRLAAGMSGMAGFVALSSAAWACTVVMGITKVSNPSNGTYTSMDREGNVTGPGVKGFRGDTLKVMSWELKPNAKYSLWFVFPDAVAAGKGCHAANSTNTYGVIMKTPSGTALKKMLSDGAGQLDRDPNTAGAQPYKAVIPNDPRTETGGTAELCGREFYPVVDQTATQHVKLTIL